MASQDIWQVLAVLPDVEEYFGIFDDYLDFKIHPWDAHGFDQGEMFPERKVALRFLTLAMNIAKNDPSNLPTDLHSFMSEYLPQKYQIPKSQLRKQKRKYSDVRKEKIEEEQTSADGRATPYVPSSTVNTGLSRQAMQGFDMSARAGSAMHDVIEKKETRLIGQGKMGPRYLDISTRSVFWDVPGEDALDPSTFDWRRFASPEDIEKVDNPKKKK